jgi:Methyltransferase domain
MYGPNVRRIEDSLQAADRVLDVGGWYRPWARADAVVDVLPYATRGVGGSTGRGPEHFDESTWYVQDVCAVALPFPDKSFDFVACSHTLEDVRDPVFLCSELARVASRGYIEVPSRAFESVRGVEGRHYAGLYHHRWLVEIADGAVVFRVKAHAIHEDRRYHLPRRYLRRLTEAERVQWLFWEGSFSYAEAIQVSHVLTRRELAAFVDRTAPLNLRERLMAIARSPAVARQYHDLRAVRHPLDVRVARDDLADERLWAQLGELHSGAQHDGLETLHRRPHQPPTNGDQGWTHRGTAQ